MPAQELVRPVFLPIIIGTPRQGRLTEPAANFVFGEVSKRGDIETELIDIRKIPIRMDDAGEALKDSQFCATVERADGLIIVAPEYNHSFPGLLKHVLDTNLEEYIHKAVGVCGVSAGPFGGARMIQFAPGATRARLGHDFLGCLFRHGRKALRSSDWQDHRSSLHPSRGEIFKRTCLDGARAPVRAREHPSAVILLARRGAV